MNIKIYKYNIVYINKNKYDESKLDGFLEDFEYLAIMYSSELLKFEHIFEIFANVLFCSIRDFANGGVIALMELALWTVKKIISGAHINPAVTIYEHAQNRR